MVTRRRSGFTLVEIMISIIVIAILAGIILANYNGTQAKARDAKRMSQLNSLAEAITSYRLKYGDPVTTSCSGGTSNAWFSSGEGWLNASTGSYTSSILSCLNAKGYLDKTYVDPSGCVDTSGTPVSGSSSCGPKGYAYAKSTCVDPSNSNQTITILMAKLEASGSTSNLTGTNALCDSATWAGSPSYLNYMIRVD